MSFNSIDFAIFLPTVFVLYWFVFKQNITKQNMLLVIASYVFYGLWDWRFLFLIFFSTIVDFTVAKKIFTAAKKNKKTYLLISIIMNIGLLAVFKYYNFFIENFVDAFTFFGVAIEARSLNIILPVGISFYTFQTLSYTIDVYRAKIKPTHNFIAFTAYVSFFPQLVAGPIERATNLLPQFVKKRKFNYQNAVDGMRQILSGLFKKIVIADNCAEYVNIIFNNYQDYNGSTLFLGAVLFAFQIYGDFSGYSDIAIGTARLFGFDLKTNFRFPYFSRDIAEFWRRWHISLSTWFRDYVYIPLGGSKGGKLLRIRNVFIIFIVSGFWHGANWTFIIWGFINALFFLPLFIFNKNRIHMDVVANNTWLPNPKEILLITATFVITVFAWIFFRADSVTIAINYISEIFSQSILERPRFHKDDLIKPLLGLLLFFISIEWIGRKGEYTLSTIIPRWKKPIRWAYYFVMVFLIFYFSGEEQQFIYFQF